MSKPRRITRRSSLHFALGACLLTAPLGAGCSNRSGLDTNIKIVDGPTIQESTKGKPRWKSKKADQAAPERRQSGRPH
jgi:hypothetical protein